MIIFKRYPSGLAFLFMKSYSLFVQWLSIPPPCFLFFSFYVLKINIQIYVLIIFNALIALFHLSLFLLLKLFLPTSPLLFWWVNFLTAEFQYCSLHRHELLHVHQNTDNLAAAATLTKMVIPSLIPLLSSHRLWWGCGALQVPLIYVMKWWWVQCCTVLVKLAITEVSSWE